MKTFLITLLFVSSINLHAAGAALAEVLLNQASKVLAKSDGILAENALKAEQDILTAVLGISSKEAPTPDELIDAVKALEAQTPDDLKLQEELLALLAKEDATAKDIVEAKDKMMLLANNLGKLDRSTILACNASCKTSGLRFQTIADDTLAGFASEVPTDKKTLLSTIKTSLRTAGFERLPRGKNYLKNGDFRNLAIYLKLFGASDLSKGKTNMRDAIKEFSTVNGKAHLVHGDNPHYFPRELISGEYKDSELFAFAKVLREATKRSNTLAGRQTAFYEVLEEMSEGHPSMKRALKKLKEQNCFFKG